MAGDNLHSSRSLDLLHIKQEQHLAEYKRERKSKKYKSDELMLNKLITNEWKHFTILFATTNKKNS